MVDLSDASSSTPLFSPERGALFDLSARAKIRISGTDRVRYLNGQFTNDVRKASATSAIHGCVLTAKGKINADVFLIDEGDSFLLDADEELREGLPARLERYVIADDVQVEDVTEEFAIFHVTGENPPSVCEELKIIRADRFGRDLWLRLR